MSQDRSRAANRLLAALPKIEYQRLEPYLISSSRPLKQVFYEASDKIETVYFPKTALISLVSTLESGATTEVSLVGGTGMVGLPAILGSGYSKHRAIVQVPNHVVQIPADILKQEFQRGGELQKILLRYTEMRLNEVAQLAVCNAHHTINERLARWLLTVSDLTQSDYLPLTQEFIGNMLGVRRSGVTVAAQIFQPAGMIEYSRGKINILNREALEDTTCECYKLFYDNYYRQ
ncbi:Crp/Fnr family transcriptional regulator [Myxosarcina sp. GI1]|uniref:Crp/Fnr family transcriptional regulator n=1 Tax=Myxosarcina sp. GI1 TaxID=1541065 RepID=UPI0005600185|nr:Crp/Fnr family transcriptional regulator [Myxosarcina sp. GI1]